MNKSYIFILLLSLWTVTAIAQGTLSGTIIDKTNKETLIGVNIIVSDPADENKTMTNGTTTDLDGHYSIKLAAGKHRISYSSVSYKVEEIILDITDGQSIQKNISMEESSISLDAVEVVAIVRRESENILLMDQKKSGVIVEKMGAKELSRKGASNVAAGVKKVSGVSIVGSKQLFVRGLGDRYNSAQLNGLPIASPDPNKKIIKLDIFPSGIVQYLSVNKAYSAQNYADYTGALIDIVTKEYPEYGFLETSIGMGYNSQSTGNDFYRIEADGFRYMGLDVQKRRALTPEKYLLSGQNSMRIGDDFNASAFGFSSKAALPSNKFSIAGGKLFNLNDKRKLGAIVNISFDNEYSSKTNVIQRQINKQNIVDGDFVSDEYSYNTYLSTFAGLSYIHNSNHSFTYNSLWVNNGIDEFKAKVGTKPDWSNGERTALVRNAQYINYQLLSQQLIGKHTLNEQLKAHWAANYMNVSYQMPDRRELVFWTQASGNNGNEQDEWGFMTYDPNLASKRIIVDQTKHDFNATTDVDYQWNENVSVKAGLSLRKEFLDYHSYFFGYSFVGAQSGNLSYAVDINAPENYFGNEYLKNVRNNTSDIMGYQGNSHIIAAFAQTDMVATPLLHIQAGIRIEASDMSITPATNRFVNEANNINFSNIDFFPSLNLKYQLSEDMNLRLSGSRTVTRPSFFEKSPALILPEQGNNRFVGNIGTKENPNDFGYYLENAYSLNADVKWEWFPQTGDLIALSAYGKIIQDPIENISYIQGGTDKTYSVRNFPNNAKVAGLEFEVKKKWRQWFVGCNAALIYTHLNIPEDANELESSRPLQGASPYLVNADIGYELTYGKHDEKRSYFGLVYNVFGKRLYTVGINQGSQYQLPYNQLNILIKNKITDRLNIDLSFSNLLNEKFVIEQEVYTDLKQPNIKTGTEITNEYQKGLGAGISIKYKLNQQ